MITEKQRSTIQDFFERNNLCVLSSLNSSGKVQSAVVGFASIPDLTVIFSTSNQSRKYKNIMQNPQVSLVTGWDLDEFITVQYEGNTSLVTDPTQLREYQDILCTKNPLSKEFVDKPDNVYFTIKPTWIKYSDLSVDPEVFEVNF